MPEGPSIKYLAKKLQPFVGKVVQNAGGYGKMQTAWINGKKLLDIQTWGKHLLFVFKDATVKVHLNLFGSILVDKRRKVNRKFYLEFANGEINGYVVQATRLEGNPAEHYDWRTDILSSHYDAKYVKSLLKAHPEQQIADLLMEQDIFTGVGNIIRSEALYVAGIHPLSVNGKIPAEAISKLLKATVKCAKDWYNNMLAGKKLQTKVYHQEFDPDGSEVTTKLLTKTKRKIYYSEHRQQLYK